MSATTPKALTLSNLIETGGWLSIRCTNCSREKVLNAFEAAHRYGHDLSIPEVRAVIRARCKSTGCHANIGLALPHQIPTVQRTKPP